MRKSLPALFALLCISLALQAQSGSKVYQIRATIRDSIIKPGQLYKAQSTDVLRIEISAAPGVDFEVRATSAKIVLSRNMGAGIDLPSWKIPSNANPCALTIPLAGTTARGKMTYVLEGIYTIQNGKRKSINVPIADRSFPIEI